MKKVILIFGYKLKVKLRHIIQAYILNINTGCSDINLHASIPNSTIFAHKGLGVVIDAGVIIGENCKIYQHVTLGGRGNYKDIGSPILGNNVTVYSYACVLGHVILHDGCVIGACSLVLKDVPAYTVVKGVWK